MNPTASQHLPWFITGPGDTDTLFWVTTVVVIAAILLIGVMYFWLHTLPERLGHKKLQFQVVAVLGLLSLFTHVHAFWIMGLLLAVIDLPDFLAPLRRIADSTEKLAAVGDVPAAVPPPAVLPPEDPPLRSIAPAMPAPTPQPKA